MQIILITILKIISMLCGERPKAMSSVNLVTFLYKDEMKTAKQFAWGRHIFVVHNVVSLENCK